VSPRSFDKGHFRLFLAPLLLVHRLNLLFNNPNGLIESNRVRTHPLDFNGRKPLTGVLRGLAQRFEMSGPTQERQIIFGPAATWARK
jgi:hypothetical protein